MMRNGKKFSILFVGDGLFDDYSITTKSHISIDRDVHTYKKKKYSLSVLRYRGQFNQDCYKEFEYLRNNVYEFTQCVVLTFDLMDPSSLEEIYNLWTPEITQHLSDKPIILAGKRSIERDKAANSCRKYFVTTEEGEGIMHKIGACKYVEHPSSALSNMDSIFDACIEEYEKKLILCEPEPELESYPEPEPESKPESELEPAPEAEPEVVE